MCPDVDGDVSTLIFYCTAFSKRGATGLCGHLQVIKTVYVQGFLSIPYSLLRGFQMAFVRAQKIRKIAHWFHQKSKMCFNFSCNNMQVSILKGTSVIYFLMEDLGNYRQFTSAFNEFNYFDLFKMKTCYILEYIWCTVQEALLERKASGFGSGTVKMRKKQEVIAKKNRKRTILFKRQ